MRPASSSEDRLWERVAWYAWYADRYHWTPAQVDDLPAWYMHRLPAVQAIFDEVAAEKQRAAMK